MKTTRRTLKAHKFHPVQNVYFMIRAEYETVYAAFRAEVKALGLVVTNDMTEAQAEAVWDREEEIRAKHGIDRLSTAKIEAERALINWALDRSTAFAPDHRKTAEIIRDKVAYSPKVWAQMVDLASRLA